MEFKKFHNKILVHMKTFTTFKMDQNMVYCSIKVGLYVSFRICLYVRIGLKEARKGSATARYYAFMGMNFSNYILLPSSCHAVVMHSKRSSNSVFIACRAIIVQFSRCYWVVSSTFQVVQILVQSHFELVNLILALEATELASEPVTQMAVELINNHLISVQQKR